MRGIISVAVAGILAGSISAANAGTVINKDELLTAQNKYRTEVGLPPLVWSDDLAKSAQEWAVHLGQIKQMVHSGALGKGENLAFWSTGKASLTKLVDLWGAEKHFFIHSQFPDVSTTGVWEDVAHYTQLVWKNSTDVGCGIATGGGNDYLVCQYQPQGNIFEQKVY
jgi:hypothetical protein